MAERTDATWETFIQSKISDILYSSSGSEPTSEESTDLSLPFASISFPTDPRFPLAIDHTLLKPDATPAQIDALCDEAIKYGFKSCCINGLYVKQVAARIKAASQLDTNNAHMPIVCCVIGFPLGAGTTKAMAYEAQQAVRDGALEIDTVIPLGLLLSKPPKYTLIFQHFQTIIETAYPAPVKVIIETRLIPTPELKIAACVLAAEAGAAFVKTCTGFAAGGGATKEDVRLMYKAVKYKGNVKVKASGGVRTFEACKELFAAGAERIGTSSGASLLQ